MFLAWRHPNFGFTTRFVSIGYHWTIGIILESLGCGISGSLFILLSFSHSQVVTFFKWKHHYLSENIAIFHPNDDFFTQYLLLNEERCHLTTFSWRLENESERKKEPCPCFDFYYSIIIFYKKLSLYIHIPNIFLGLSFEFGP